jgi:hypothetical protein
MFNSVPFTFVYDPVQELNTRVTVFVLLKTTALKPYPVKDNNCMKPTEIQIAPMQRTHDKS